MRNRDDRLWNAEEGYNADGMSIDERDCDTGGGDLPEDDGDPERATRNEQNYDTDDVPQPEDEDFPPFPPESVPGWRIVAIGKRPEDYIIRDLIFGSLFRTPAPARLHRHIRWSRSDSPPSWVLEELGHLSAEDRHVAIPLLALVREWHNFLDFHIDPNILPEDELMNSGGHPTPRRLRACWPVGALLEWAGEGKIPSQKKCNRPWACPWCYARHVYQLYDRLRRGPLRQPRRGSYLVQASVSFTPDMIIVQPENQAWIDEEYRLDRPSPISPPWWLEDGTLNFHRILRQEVVDAMRQSLSSFLKNILGRIGMTGGLWTHRVVPALTEAGQRSFRHECSVLGMVDLRSPRAMAAFRRETGIDGDWVEMWDGKRFSARVLVAALPADHPNALRYLLCGTSAGYHLDTLPLIVREEALQLRPCRWCDRGHFPFGDWLNNGLPGAFALTPWFLFERLQWRTYLDRTDRLPLYRTFGDWRPSVPPLRQRTRGRSVSRTANLRRLALRLWADVKHQAQTGERGRPAYGAVLQSLMATKGMAVSRREITDLLQWLHSQDQSPI